MSDSLRSSRPADDCKRKRVKTGGQDARGPGEARTPAIKGMLMSIATEKRRAVVAGRECGACTVCCKVLPIRADGFQKTANVLCRHCDEGRGCRIYQARPKFCHGFYCGWRLNAEIPATWRPDKSGIFIQRIPREQIEELPSDTSTDDAIMFMLLRPDAIERPAITELIAGFVSRRVATFLAIPGPPGYLPTQMFLNEVLDEAVRDGDMREMSIMIRQAVAALRRQEFERAPV